MRLSNLTLVFATLGAVSAFAPLHHSEQQISTHLNLFGGGAKKDGANKGPNMMDQLAMFKKAQEMAQKKQKLDQELAAMTYEGVAADGKVKATFKFVPIQNPMDPNPDYEATAFEFDDEWYEAASPDDISAAVKGAIMDAIKNTNLAATEKYQALQGDLMEAFGQKGDAPPES